MPDSSLVESFLDQYKREQDFYDEVGAIAQKRLEKILAKLGIKAVVSHRAKRVSSLRKKLLKRSPEKQYHTLDDIYRDIVDLCGVRVALYFPGDRDKVGRVILEMFNQLEPAKHFPEDTEKGDALGYTADHYRVALRPESLDEDEDQRYSQTMIEIQVASVLMHAWSEVTHDLVYKPEKGTLSDSEIKILKELNVIVKAGEAALERLQRGIEERTDEDLRFQLVSHVKTASVEARPYIQKLTAAAMGILSPPEAPHVYVVEGENRPLMGFNSLEDAEQSYQAENPQKQVEEILEVTFDELFGTSMKFMVDFDGVLAHHEPHNADQNKIGKPLKAGKALLDYLVDRGNEVAILTARDPKFHSSIHDWILENMGHDLRVTNVKESADAYIDDRAIWWPRNL